jgi:hypothetical protein
LTCWQVLHFLDILLNSLNATSAKRAAGLSLSFDDDALQPSNSFASAPPFRNDFGTPRPNAYQEVKIQIGYSIVKPLGNYFLGASAAIGGVGSSASVPGKAGVVAACCFAAAWPNPQTRPGDRELRKADAKRSTE